MKPLDSSFSTLDRPCKTSYHQYALATESLNHCLQNDLATLGSGEPASATTSVVFRLTAGRPNSVDCFMIVTEHERLTKVMRKVLVRKLTAK